MSALALNRSDVLGDDGGERLVKSARLVWLVAALFAVLIGWAWIASLDEVATGAGRVVPTKREQIIQSLEGGILTDLTVRQDDIVYPGQILAQLDPAQASSTVDESTAKYRAAQAMVLRLKAEVNGGTLRFPDELADFPDLIDDETRLYNSRRQSLHTTQSLIQQSISLVSEELDIAQRLFKVGAASNVEMLRLQRQRADLERQKADVHSQYVVEARQDLAKSTEAMEALEPVIRGRADTLKRLTLRSPVRGIVKNIEVSTIGGVVPPNGKLMEIIPLDDALMIEARIAPRDIAFIRPGQRASVKISAYDYSIYGGLEGKVVSISPDTIRDENDPDAFYYRVFIRTRQDALVNKAGRRFPIGPGMIATADVHTGSKTVLQYLLKPINRAREGLRER